MEAEASFVRINGEVGIHLNNTRRRMNTPFPARTRYMNPVALEKTFEIYPGVKVIDVGADIFERGLCLPSDNKMTAETQERIIEIIRSCVD